MIRLIDRRDDKLAVKVLSRQQQEFCFWPCQCKMKPSTASKYVEFTFYMLRSFIYFDLIQNLKVKWFWSLLNLRSDILHFSMCRNTLHSNRFEISIKEYIWKIKENEIITKGFCLSKGKRNEIKGIENRISKNNNTPSANLCKEKFSHKHISFECLPYDSICFLLTQ